MKFVAGDSIVLNSSLNLLASNIGSGDEGERLRFLLPGASELCSWVVS